MHIWVPGDGAECGGPWPLLGVIPFPFHCAALPRRGSFALRELVALALDLPDACKLAVTGFTDDIGPIDYNRQLALARAMAVARVLLDAGLPPWRLRLAGVAKRCYLAGNDSAEGRAANRRVEVRQILP